MQVISANRTFRKRPRQASRCTGSPLEQTTPRTTGIVANGFLKKHFLPLYQPSASLPEQSTLETAYLQSAKYVAEHYRIDLLEIKGFSYPYNIILSHWDISRKIAIKGRYRELVLKTTEGRETQLSVKETINTGHTLYYIPLEPLYNALQNPDHICAKLLFGVCIYLHQQAGVCHYLNSESYVCYLYEIIDTWLEDDRDYTDEEDYKQQRSILDNTFAIGDKMRFMLSDESHLHALRMLLNDFVPQNRFDSLCFRLAQDTLSIWTEYPQANIFQHIDYSKEDDDDDYYGNGKLRVNDYISFIGETSSCVYDTLMNMANEDFNERSGVQDFETTTDFNAPCGVYFDNLDYEEKIMAVFSRLCTLIEEMP